VKEAPLLSSPLLSSPLLSSPLLLFSSSVNIILAGLSGISKWKASRFYLHVDRTPSIIEERTKLPIIMEEQPIMEAIDKNV
jgi:hypothetical protein